MNRNLFLIVFVILLFSISYAQFLENRGMYASPKYLTQNVNWANSLEQPWQRGTKMINMGRKNMDNNIPITTPDNRQPTPKEAITLQTIIKDFKVNDNTSGNHNYPCVAMNGIGDFVIVWALNVPGGHNRKADIYAQRYNNEGIAQGSNFKVNDCSGSASYSSLCIAMDDTGNFVITWADERSGILDIYAQRYNSKGIAQGQNFKVNDDPGWMRQLHPSIAMNRSGNFVITWDDKRSDNYDIYAQMYNSAGKAIGTNFKVNDDNGSSERGDPSIAIDDSGNFIIAWSDERNGNYDIYAQRYYSDGSAIGTNFKVNDDSTHRKQMRPCIAMDEIGNFIIVWDDIRTYQDIYCQMYDNAGNAQGKNFKVNNSTGWSFSYAPCVVIDRLGNFVIAWEDGRNGNYYDIYAKRFNSDGSAIDIEDFKVNTAEGTGSSAQYIPPCIATDGSGNFVIIWNDMGDYNRDIYAQRYDSNGSPKGKNFIVNDDTLNSDQFDPSLDIDGSGNFIIAWSDERNGNYDIYAQRYYSNGSAQGTNFKVNDDTGSTMQIHTSIAVDESGNSVIVWSDYRNDYGDIYAQRFNRYGKIEGKNFKVNDDTLNLNQYGPSIAVDSSGNFIIAWSDERNGNYDIYAQRYNSDGSAIGTNFKVNDDTLNFNQRSPCIAVNRSGNFVVAWHDERNGDPDIYAQRYNSDGYPEGKNFRVNDDITAPQYFPCIALDEEGNFVIAWRDDRNGDSDIFTQRFNNDGSVEGANFRVNDDTGSSSQNWPCISIESSGNFIIAWTDSRNGYDDIYAQRYYSDGTEIGNNFRVTAVGDKRQFSNDVKLSNGKIYNTWTSNHVSGTGYDIWANVLDWNNPTSINDSKVSKSSFINEYQLMQNYPNPFNPSTTIRFALPIAGHVKLCIYNNLGQRVETLLNAFKPAGWHEVRFYAGHLASGVYYYKIQAYNFIQVKKMLLMR